MKYLFILFIFACVAVYLYWRLRPYLKMAGHMLGIVRDARRMSVSQNPGGIPRRQPPADTQANAERLVRCAVCDTWLPTSRAVTLRGSHNAYCSHACLERASDPPQSTRRSAS